jgi:hypothetical protein
VYFQIQRIASLVAEAAQPHRSGFEPEFRLRQELRRVLRDVSEEAVPADLREALISGAIVGPAASRWLPVVRAWLETECQRTGV